MPHTLQTWSATAALGVSVLACTACGGPAPRALDRKPTFPVAGKVLLNDQPVKRAIVTFHPLEGEAKAVRAYARTDASGSFTLSTYEIGDGAPPGKYGVTLLPDADDSNVSIPERYANPHTSGLTIEVKQETNELPPFRLRR